MENISFLKIFMIFGIVSGWAKQAMEDGKITLVEAAELATELGELLDIPVEVEIPAPNPLPFEPSAGEESDAPPLETTEEQPPGERLPHRRHPSEINT